MPIHEEVKLDAALEALAARRARKLYPCDDERQINASVSYYRRLIREYLS